MNSHSDLNSLDQFSTSPTGLVLPPSKKEKACINGAPYFAFQNREKTFVVVQGCCNDWLCPRCGEIRAKAEYGRIVEGVKSLVSESRIFFITITCRGKELTKDEADSGYGAWTNRFLDACRARSKRKGGRWVYVQVTERQKRSHPHSHILTTFDPLDLYLGHVLKWKNLPHGGGHYEREIALRSDWLQNQAIKSGLGEQYDISIVNSADGAARYVAKYLFKSTIFSTRWPKGWKRVRYSQSFPRLPERETDAFVLMSANDWFMLAADAERVTAIGKQAYIVASQALAPYPVKVTQKKGT